MEFSLSLITSKDKHSIISMLVFLYLMKYVHVHLISYIDAFR